MDKEKQFSFLMKEHERCWAYYLRTLDERRYAIDYYFRVVGIPASLAGLLGLALKSNPLELIDTTIDNLIGVLAAVLVVLSLSGTSLFFYYLSETKVSKKYLNQSTELRKELRFSLNLSEIKHFEVSRLSITPLLRSGFMVFFNSAMYALIALVLNASNQISVVVFLVAVLLHAAAYFLFVPVRSGAVLEVGGK